MRVAGHLSGRFTRAQALTLVQLWDQSGHFPQSPEDKRFVGFKAKYALTDIGKWRQRARALRHASNRIEAFDLFSGLEQAVESLEIPTDELENAIQTSLELDADVRRGK